MNKIKTKTIFIVVIVLILILYISDNTLSKNNDIYLFIRFKYGFTNYRSLYLREAIIRFHGDEEIWFKQYLCRAPNQIFTKAIMFLPILHESGDYRYDEYIEKIATNETINIQKRCAAIYVMDPRIEKQMLILSELSNATNVTGVLAKQILDHAKKTKN